MFRSLCLTMVTAVLLIPLSGCTDIVEPNEIAFVLGTAVDNADNGEIELSHQIVLPTQKNGPFKGGSGSAESFVVLSATGRDVYDASQHIQMKVSRKLMTSHRILIAISENFFNKNDVGQLFDKLNRDPANNQRDLTILVKGSAKEFLMLGHPMEHLSSIAAGKELHINGASNFSTRQFIIDSAAQGTRPLVPAFQIQSQKLSNKETVPIAGLAGYALLNKKLKVKGVLNDHEGSEVAWMAGKGTLRGLTIPWKNGKGNLSFRLTHLERHIQTKQNQPEHIQLVVKAHAFLLENTTLLDMSEVSNMIEAEHFFNTYLDNELQAAMDKVKQKGTDVFGIGEHLHRKYPTWWRAHSGDWDEEFRNIDVSVKSDVTLRSIGASGGPLNH